MWEPWIGKYGPARATVQANLMKEEWLIEVVITAACSKDYPEDKPEAEEEVNEKPTPKGRAKKSPAKSETVAADETEKAEDEKMGE